MATVNFEPYNGGAAFRTAFYTQDSAALAHNETFAADGGDLVNTITFAKTSDADIAPTTESLIVRSFEIYVDDTVDGTPGVMSRLAKVAVVPTGVDPATIDIVGYDVLISNVTEFVPDVDVDSFTLDIKNVNMGADGLTPTALDVRVVYVVDVRA